MEMMANNNNDVKMKEATELRLGLPGTTTTTTTDHGDHHQMAGNNKMMNINNKRASPEVEEEINTDITISSSSQTTTAPPPKAQIVGWPPVKSYRKSNIVNNNNNNNVTMKTGDDPILGGMYVKVSMDGAAYLRKVDLKLYNGYSELFKALETMFNLTIGQNNEYAAAYHDKDGDLMLVGDVPWQMFMQSCKRLRIMKGADARGLAATAAQ